MRINTNVSSLTAQEAAVNTNNRITGSLEKLSTGLRINKASDDASGLAIADKLRTQATSISQGIANGNSAVSLLQIADKSMGEQSNILDTIKAKLIQANTATTSADGRESIRKDIGKLLEQLDNISKQTNYNGTSLLQASRNDASESSGLKFQVGESDTDLITNTAVQSNTTGLAGKEEKISVAAASLGKANVLSQGEGQIVKQGDNVADIEIKAASGNTSLAVGGKVGTITATSDIKISNISASDLVKLKELDAAATAGDIVDNNNGTFTLGAGKSINFADFTVNSMTLTSGAADAISFKANAANDKFTVQNLGAKDATIGAGHADSEVGLSLSSLKGLAAGGLTTESADIYQGVIDTSITKLNGYRGDIGSTQNQVESAVRNLMTQATNVKAAESIIRDVDYAEESANFNKLNIISQAGSYAISQSNATQQNFLRLLQ